MYYVSYYSNNKHTHIIGVFKTYEKAREELLNWWEDTQSHDYDDQYAFIEGVDIVHE